MSDSRHRFTNAGQLIAAAGIAVLALCTALNAHAQIWVSTATQAYPVEYLQNAIANGSLAPSTPIHIVVGLQQQNADQVQPTLKQMLTPGDPLYGTSLTVQQFVEQFGATAAQVQAVENYLSAAGFRNVTAAANQLLVEADGTAAGVEAAFNTTLQQYSVNGTTVYLNTAPAQVPDALSGIVIAVLGLNNVPALHSTSRTLQTGPNPQTSPCNPPTSCPAPDVANETFTPQQYQIAYHAASPAGSATTTSGGGGASSTCSNSFAAPQLLSTGKCTAVGIIAEGDLGSVSPQNRNAGTPSASSTGVIHDLYLFEQAYQLPAVPVTIVNAGIPSPDTSGAGEWDLDSQSSTGIAQQVSHLYFYVATSLTDSDIGLAINKAVSDDKVKAFNMSFGECEFFPYVDGAMLLDDEMFGEAALQGMTPFASSDDQGSACPVVGTNDVPLSGPPDTSYPASSPYVIAVGGTNLFTNANYTYDYEVAWESGGGGPSYFETPGFWQQYTGSGTLPIVPSAAANSAVGCPMGCRGVPDVSMCAGGTGLAICAAITYVNGTPELIGGTSLSSPLSMGAWARIESSHQNKLGFAGPLIYQLANGLPQTNLGSLSPYFNDVWTGSNGLYSATPGWDFVTGLGSWDILVVNQNIPSTYPH